jgi:hypothetical protein
MPVCIYGNGRTQKRQYSADFISINYSELLAAFMTSNIVLAKRFNRRLYLIGGLCW